MIKFAFLFLFTLVFLSACDEDETNITPDTTAPTVSDSTIGLTDLGGGNVQVVWNAATDNITAQSSIVYKVVQSTANDVTTLSDAEANGTVVMDWTANTTTASVSVGGGTHYFNIIAKDAAGNKTVYASNTISIGGCFLGETMILLADGSSKRIDQMVPGDRVLSYDQSGTVMSSTVGQVFIHQVDEYLDLITSTGRVGVTANHPFYAGANFGASTSTPGFQPIGHFAKSSNIYAYTGESVLSQTEIVSADRIRADVVVYNLHISEGPPTYFANGFAVHNK